MNLCPKCMKPTKITELEMYDGYCEECYEEMSYSNEE